MASGDFKFTVKESDYIRITRALEQMSDIEQHTILKRSYKEGSAMLLVAGKASFLAHNKKYKGNLYRSFTDKLKTKKKNIGGVLVGFKRGKGKGNHSHLIDKGTTHRFTKKAYVDKLGRHYPAGLYRGKIDQAGIGSRGRMKTGATYFWSKVAEQKGPEAMNNIAQAIYRAIEAITR